MSIASLADHHCNLYAAMRPAKLADAIPTGFDMIHRRVQDYVTLAITGKARISLIQLRPSDPIQTERALLNSFSISCMIPTDDPRLCGSLRGRVLWDFTPRSASSANRVAQRGARRQSGLTER